MTGKCLSWSLSRLGFHALKGLQYFLFSKCDTFDVPMEIYPTPASTTENQGTTITNVEHRWPR